MVAAVLFWGTQFPLSQVIMRHIDQYWFGVLRYSIGVSLFVITLWWREGRGGFVLEGRGATVALHGICGFTGFGLLVFWSLYYTTPAHAAIIMAMQPMLIAFWLWISRGQRPRPHTLACIAAAFAGLALIITRGDLSHALGGGSLIGDAMVFVGAIGWIVYTLGAARFPRWSPLRYTTLTCVAGTAGVFAIAAFLTPLGLARLPTPAVVWEQLPAITYIAVFPFYIAIFLFGIAVARLGAVNTLLIGNGVPLVVFVIDALRGQMPRPPEWAGAILVIGALVVSNLLDRSSTSRA